MIKKVSGHVILSHWKKVYCKVTCLFERITNDWVNSCPCLIMGGIPEIWRTSSFLFWWRPIGQNKNGIYQYCLSIPGLFVFIYWLTLYNGIGTVGICKCCNWSDITNGPVAFFHMRTKKAQNSLLWRVEQPAQSHV